MKILYGEVNKMNVMKEGNENIYTRGKEKWTIWKRENEDRDTEIKRAKSSVEM